MEGFTPVSASQKLPKYRLDTFTASPYAVIQKVEIFDFVVLARRKQNATLSSPKSIPEVNATFDFLYAVPLYDDGGEVVLNEISGHLLKYYVHLTKKNLMKREENGSFSSMRPSYAQFLSESNWCFEVSEKSVCPCYPLRCHHFFSRSDHGALSEKRKDNPMLDVTSHATITASNPSAAINITKRGVLDYMTGSPLLSKEKRDMVITALQKGRSASGTLFLPQTDEGFEAYILRGLRYQPARLATTLESWPMFGEILLWALQ